MNTNTKKVDIRSIAQIAMMAAITCIATTFFRLPSLTGYTHIGDSMVFIGVILLGKKKGIVSAATGMFLADVFAGYLIWSPFTLVIKAIMSGIVGLIAFRGNYEGKNALNNIAAFIAGGVWELIGYLFAGVLIAKLTIGGINTLQAGLIISLKDVPGNVMQVIVGVVIAVPAILLLQHSKAFGAAKAK